jgi:hypothetical protein
MSEFYRIHFASSKTSKRYPQALKLAALAYEHDTHESTCSRWHTVTFSDEQVDLMAAFYNLKVHLLTPRPYLIGEREWFQEIRKVEAKLRQEGYLDRAYFNEKGEYVLVRATRKPQEYIPSYREIKALIAEGYYVRAVEKYYDTLGREHYGELHSELIYLKRLASIPFVGRDLLYFYPKSSRLDLINAQAAEYCNQIDTVLVERERMGLKSLLDILKELAPTMEDLIAQKQDFINRSIRFANGNLVRDKPEEITEGWFSAQYGGCPAGRLFSRYPEQVRHCRVVEMPEHTQYMGLWCACPPELHQKEILDKGLILCGVDAYKHRKSRWVKGKLEPDFTTAHSLEEVAKGYYATNGIKYTGRSYSVEGLTLYEVDLVREDLDRAELLGNPFLETIEEILREAENRLREQNGLPRIGEGWISEVQMFNLVKRVFGDAQFHASPKWIRPQHLDVYVPSKNLAFEYQGRQHFEPIDFFGGEIGLAALKMRDQRKKSICERRKVILVEWREREPLERDVLVHKLMAVGIRLGEGNQ